MSFKHAAVRMTAAILSVSAMLVPALAVSGTVNTGSSKLNLRAAPGTNAAVVTKLSGGSVVEVLETSNGWSKISYADLTGYVSAQYLDIIEAAEPAVTEPAAEITEPVEVEPAEAVEAAEAPAGTEAAETLYGRVITSSLNIRTGPATSYDKAGKLRAGKVVEILEVLDGWYRIEGGYISAEYVQQVDESALSPSATANQVVELALSYVGSPYVYGGSSPKGFDCSGFTSYVYKQFGISLNRSSSNQLDNGTPVAMSELLPGDLVIFKKYASSAQRASHVGLYIGNGQFVHASTYGVGVIVSNMSDAYYTTGFVGGRRIV